jgi:hypothetical protein
MTETDPMLIIDSFRNGRYGTVADLLYAIDNRIKRSSRPDRAILLVLRGILELAYENEAGERITDPSVKSLLQAIGFAYMAGSVFSTKFTTRSQTKAAIAARARKNRDWVRPFNKALLQAHRTGLKAGDAIHEARKRLNRNGVKIPVGDEALRWRERELRTGKKRR